MKTIERNRVKKVLKKLLDNKTSLVYTAEKNIELFKKFNLETSEIVKINNALNDKVINPVDLSKYGIKESSYIMTMVSRAIPEKGWEEAVKIIKHAREISGKDIHLLMIGDGPEAIKLETKEKETDYIHFLGFKSNIRDYFKASHLGLLTSKFKGESYPLVLIDCLVSGTPFLASDIGEIKEMLKTKDGSLAGNTFKLKNWEIDVKEVGDMISTLFQ